MLTLSFFFLKKILGLFLKGTFFVVDKQDDKVIISSHTK